MNKRIKELMLEAGYAAPEIALRAQKLVDLVTKDCIDTIMNSTDRYRKEYFADLITKHFGVTND